MGSIFNLLIEWTPGTSTWEPMHAVVTSDPLAVASYARENNLFGIKGWVHLQRYEARLDQEQPRMEAFKGGKQFLGETSFKLLVRVLTSGDERLVKSVDYVKGLLIHDNIMTLQRIINDLLDRSAYQQQKLTDNLTILGNYLKVQYKKHASMPNSARCDAHGLLYGLTATNSQPTKPHYSNMDLPQLKQLLVSRNLFIKATKSKNVTMIARALDFDDWSGFPKDQASFDALILKLKGLKKAGLVAVAEQHELCIAGHWRRGSTKVYLEGLTMALDDKFTNRIGTLVPVLIKSIKCWHLTLSFLSYFMFIQIWLSLLLLLQLLPRSAASVVAVDLVPPNCCKQRQPLRNLV
jgi:hypothetical protein